MSLTKFSMVEELASLVKDNFSCKDLVLSIEEVLVDFLQHHASLGGVLELEPMNPYERLLIHRLAEIFGFSHYSVGEGEERHLVLEHCTEASMPPMLVSDLLWQAGEVTSPMILDMPTRKKTMSGQGDSAAFESADSCSGRDTMFSTDMQSKLAEQRPRNDVVVARRMIAHALGKTNKEMTSKCSSNDTKEKDGKVHQGNVSSRKKQNLYPLLNEHPASCAPPNADEFIGHKSSSALQEDSSASEQKYEKEKQTEIHEKHLRLEQMGAAKRLFANALGMQQRDIHQSKHRDGIAKKAANG